ncbi:hypothetical protein ABPG74_012209 [Tetrahymena malaccensis]
MNQDIIVDDQGRYVFRLQFRLPEKRFAQIVCQTIEVDKELNDTVVEKQIFNNDSDVITLIYRSKDAKKIRSAIKNTIENICLSLETINKFK